MSEVSKIAAIKPAETPSAILYASGKHIDTEVSYHNRIQFPGPFWPKKIFNPCGQKMPKSDTKWSQAPKVRLLAIGVGQVTSGIIEANSHQPRIKIRPELSGPIASTFQLICSIRDECQFVSGVNRPLPWVPNCSSTDSNNTIESRRILGSRSNVRVCTMTHIKNIFQNNTAWF